MNINFKGLVELHTLPTTEPLLPLYEAIVNSIQSIAQANVENGEINIHIKREPVQSTFNDWETDIDSITIQDNGIGFTEENFISFNTYASDFKKMLGCKGVGRMTWLKAFGSVFIESVYFENGKYNLKQFTFDSENEVSNIVTNDATEQNNCTTIH